MIIAQASAILADLRTCDQLRIDSQNALRLKTRSDQLQSIASKVNTTLQSYNLLYKHEITDAPKQPTTLLDQIEKCEKDFLEDEMWIEKDNVFEELQKKADAWNKQGQSIMTQAWSSYVDNLLPTIPAELLDVLGKIPAFQDGVRSINRTLEEARQNKSRLPVVEQEICVIKEKADTVHKAWKEMGTDDVPPAVLIFLRAAGGQGAGLTTFTPEIGAWLDEHKMSRFFSIRLKTW